MSFWKWISTQGKSKPEKAAQILGLSIFVFLLVAVGNIACQKEAVEEVVQEEESTGVKVGLNKYEGTVKTGIGKYLFIPEFEGFDIIVQGQIESGDLSTLVNKEVRGEGIFSADKPSILLAQSIEVKESESGWRTVFTKTEEFVSDDYMSQNEREEFQILSDLSYDKKEGWEGKEKGKILGRLEKETVTEGEEQKDIYRIIVLDEQGKEIAKIAVDTITDFALYYKNKLRLFDSFWFYITIKDTVEWSIRRRTREMFQADVLFCGIY
jgi:hypothetical protein